MPLTGGPCRKHALSCKGLTLICFFLTYFCEYHLGTTKGFYVYIETSSPRKANETARLSSVVFRPSGPNDSCYLRFWYHMFGQDVDSLNINFRTSVTGPLKGIWNLTGKETLVRIFFLVLCRGLDFVVANRMLESKFFTCRLQEQVKKHGKLLCGGNIIFHMLFKRVTCETEPRTLHYDRLCVSIKYSTTVSSRNSSFGFPRTSVTPEPEPWETSICYIAQ